VEVKRHFVQLSLCKRQQINVLRLLPFQLIRECLPDIFGSEDLEQSTCKSDWEKLHGSKCFVELGLDLVLCRILKIG
jgi:hypothetical protein